MSEENNNFPSQKTIECAELIGQECVRDLRKRATVWAGYTDVIKSFAIDMEVDDPLIMASAILFPCVLLGNLTLRGVFDVFGQATAYVIKEMLKIEIFHTNAEHDVAIEEFKKSTYATKVAWALYAMMQMRRLRLLPGQRVFPIIDLCYLAHVFLIADTKLIPEEINAKIIESVKETAPASDEIVWTAEFARQTIKDAYEVHFLFVQ
jgi:hypothetical protein